MPGLFDSSGGPEFSLAGMILGGRGYASNWFSQRDQALWQRAEQARQDAAEKAYGAELLNRPDYQRFRDQPYDRGAGLDFWAGTRGAPGDIDQDIAGYVGTGITAQYNKTQSELNAQQQRENLQFSSNLNLKETDYRTDKELQLYKDKAAFDDARKQKMLDSLQGVPGEVAANMRFDMMYPGVRQPDQSIGFDPIAGPYMRPSTGSAEHIKMMSQLTAGETVVNQLTQMQTQLESGDYTRAGWNSTQANLMLTAKSLFESGALDQGSLDVLQAMIPKIGFMVGSGPEKTAVQEKIRATILQLKQRNADVIATFSTPLRDLPGDTGNKKYFPVPRGEPPEKGSVTEAQKTIKAQPKVPAPDYGRSYKPGEGGGSVFQ
jgi:hypothetical protein